MRQKRGRLDLSIWLTLNFDFAPTLVKQGIGFLSVFISEGIWCLKPKGILNYCSNKKYVFWSEQLIGVPWIFFILLISCDPFFCICWIQSSNGPYHDQVMNFYMLVMPTSSTHYLKFGPPHWIVYPLLHTTQERDFVSYWKRSISINQGEGIS